MSLTGVNGGRRCKGRQRGLRSQVDKSRVGREVGGWHTRTGSQAHVGHGDDGGDAGNQLGAFQLGTLRRKTYT